MKKCILIIVGIFTIWFMGNRIAAVISVIDYHHYYHAKKLCKAVEAQDIELVKEILEERPACINASPTLVPEWYAASWDSYHSPYAFYLACRTDNVELIQVLIDAGADVNGRDGAVPLSVVYTLKKENWYVISRMLIENGATVNYETEESWGKFCVLSDIVRSRPGGIPDNEDEVMLSFQYAMEHCNHKNVDWADVLEDSVSGDRIEIVKYLLDEGYCDVNNDGCSVSPLMFAARDSTLDMVKLLLDYGADKNYRSPKYGKTAYDFALEKGKQDLLPLLEVEQ